MDEKRGPRMYFLGFVSVVAIIIGLAATQCSKGGSKQRAASSGASAPAVPETQIRFGIGAEPKTIDSTKCYETAGIEVVMNYCEPLVWYDQQTLQPIPGVAERWEVSPDGKTYTFHLRGNAMWWGGALAKPELVTASDFVNAWRRLLDPETGAQYVELPRHMGITGTTAYFKDLEAYGRLAGDLANAQKQNDAARVKQLEPQVDRFRTQLTQQRSTLGFRAPDAQTFVVELEDAARGKILMKLAGFPPLCPVHQATINECGNGQGWLPKYRMSSISTPTSSRTSRTAACSSDSPGSTKPARTLYIGSTKRRPRASRISSPRVTRMMIAGETRG